MRELYEILQPLASQPECSSCILCEKNVGLVYLLGKEAERIQARGQSLISITSNQVEYLNRKAGGWCACFAEGTNTCGIYEDRPLCCRLYPLDLMEIDQAVWWVMHAECPIGQRFLQERKTDLLAAMTGALERHITFQQYQKWIAQDRTSKNIEGFRSEKLDIIKIRRFAAPEAWQR